VLSPFFAGAGLPFADILSADNITDACSAASLALGPDVTAANVPDVTRSLRL
jgi:hypothetical protein